MLAAGSGILTVGHAVRGGILQRLAVVSPDRIPSVAKFSAIIVDLFGGVFLAMGAFSLLIVMYNGLVRLEREARGQSAPEPVPAADPERVRVSILGEGARVGVVAGAVGAAAGSLVVLWLAGRGIRITALHAGLGAPGIGIVHPVWRPIATVTAIALPTLGGLLAAILPSREGAGRQAGSTRGLD